MIGSSIRGGQILVHQYRMLKQILGVAVFIAFTITFLIFCYSIYKSTDNYDLAAAYSYSVASLYSQYLDPIFPNSPATSVYTFCNNDWSKPTKLSSVSVVQHKYFIYEAHRFYEFLYSKALLSLGLFLLIILSIVLIWYWYGKKTKEHEVTRGTKIYTAQEVSDYLNHKEIASDLLIGGMPLVKNSETTHILVTGTTGSGKSNLFNTLIPQIITKKQPAVIIDLTGDMIARFYNPDRGDIIFNPFDARSHGWDLWSEVSNSSYLNIISSALYTSKNNGFDDMWNNSAKIVFNDCIEVLGTRKKKSLKELYSLLALTDLKELSRILKGTPSSTLLDPKNDKTAMSIRTNAIAYIEWMKYLSPKANNFTIRNWVGNTINNKSDNWLFLSATPEQRKMVIPIFSVMSEVFVNALMELGPDHQRRVWLIIDELPALNKLPSLSQALAELRKYGGSILCGLQSMNQLSNLYGHYEATTIFGQFNTKFIFRTQEQNIANMVSNLFGKVEYQESSENISYGAHEMRDGVSFGKVERTKPLVSVEDLASLANLECYVSLPDPICRAAKLQMQYQALKKITEPREPFEEKSISTTIKGVEVNTTPSKVQNDSLNVHKKIIYPNYNISNVKLTYDGVNGTKHKEKNCL